MKEETKLRKRKEHENQKQAIAQLPNLLPAYISGRDGDILLYAAFLTESETGELFDISARRVRQIKQQNRDAYDSLLAKKKTIVGSATLDNTFLVAMRERQFLLSEGSKVGTVQQASLLASVGSQQAKTAANLETTEDKADRPTPKQLASIILDGE